MLKAAIIGYGYMGEIRRKVIESHSELELIQVAETDESKIAPGSHPFEVLRDPRAILEGPADVVFVCTPNHLIPELTVEALKRGKHVFSEKPPGRNVGDIQSMIDAEKASDGRKLMFGFNHRFHPGVQRAKHLVESGKFGKVLWIRGLYGKSGGKNFKSSWRNQKEISGGGILLDQGIHMIDLFHFFCGEFDQVKAFRSNHFWKVPGIEDNAFVILEKPGQHAMLHSSATLWKHRFQIEIGLEKGYLTVQGFLSKSGSYGRETLTVGYRQFEDEADAVGNPAEEVTYFDRDLSWEIETKKFVTAILDNQPVKECSSRDAYLAMKVVHDAYEGSELTG